MRMKPRRSFLTVTPNTHRGHRFAAVQRLIGVLLMIFSLTMLPPAGVSMFYGDSALDAFMLGFVTTLAIGCVVWIPVRRNRADLKIRDGFLVVALFWTVLGVAGALPFWFPTTPRMTFSQAVFESISGLTTTGATVLTGIDTLPRSILYYRQQLQWLGGGGIIVLAVAILPLLGVGGMQLLRAETPGPVKDTKMTPRIKETARALWTIYLGLTVACAAAYWAAGMSLFDAIGHSFATVSTGGFSTHDVSFGYFDNHLLETISVVFMLLAAINFSLHFVSWRDRSLRIYLADPESRMFLLIALLLSVLIAVALLIAGRYVMPLQAFAKSAFQVVSIMTSTGFTTADYTIWPSFVPVLLVLSSFIGGCASSTAGGMKVIRVMLLFKQGMREVYQLVHPSAEFPVKLGRKVVPPRVLQAVWSFISAYMGFYVIMLLLLLAAGMDEVSAFAAVAACINNLGPGLGEVSANFATIDSFSLWVCSFAMLLGRLEIFAFLVLLTPAFWRR